MIIIMSIKKEGVLINFFLRTHPNLLQLNNKKTFIKCTNYPIYEVVTRVTTDKIIGTAGTRTQISYGMSG